MSFTLAERSSYVIVGRVLGALVGCEQYHATLSVCGCIWIARCE